MDAVNRSLRVCGYKEEGAITTVFDMTVLYDLDQIHQVMDVINRLPGTCPGGLELKRRLDEKRIEHHRHIPAYGQNMPEIRGWSWGWSHE